MPNVKHFRMVDVISKKRDGASLSKEEIQYFIDGCVDGSIPDYQTSALLMAIYFQGMEDRELADFTMAMAHSGDMIDLSPINGIKVDKHSTGGVGDKTTMAVAPIVASCGVKMAKMSGRGLGHTGGTVDKLESIPGYNTVLDKESFFNQVNKIGVSVIGQSGNLAPADKKLYALRDVTGSVPSIPLIASSIMSKKLAAGADCILLDVKCGSGAFMKNVSDAVTLAQKMVAIGEHNGKRTMAYVTNMDIPLGENIGNALEVKEVVDVLNGRGPADLTLECEELSATLLMMAGKGDRPECIAMVRKAIENGEAMDKFKEMVQAQGGDISVFDNPEEFTRAAVCYEVKSDREGYISAMDTESIGIASTMLGAGRETLDSIIDPTAGITICKKTGDKVNIGDVLAKFYTSREELLSPAVKRYYEALSYSQQAPEKSKLVYAVVDKDGVTMR
ncbi:Pyrimidine-nucleoside phosphorylase [Anaerovibrio sp. JC8]|uniref:pyrimidine-nucleoside phosphorylase n=1 Tax=Anaerovibrio sp. JC8 TaxID=1240085 RepID=UPI000A0C09CF|nr:pyrimidine-nucleoside phosphorylase [Anaerovibrio sp. JC8]ORU01300.1 Pyrimidine-nucleoside phosphorylase [Anaerovibrio sp. JC8]